MLIPNERYECLLCLREDMINKGNANKFVVEVIDHEINTIRSEEDEKGNDIKCS